MNTKEQISDKIKEVVKDNLRNYVDSVAGSANKAANMLTGVSNGYISLILTGKWENISDDMWRNVQKQVCSKKDWDIAETKGFKFISKAYYDACENSEAIGIKGSTGFGKTNAAENQNNPNFILVKCNEYFTPKTFLIEILSLLGKKGHTSSLADMVNVIVSTLLKMNKPLIVFDEADKLSDKVLYFFISLYNALQGKCGMVIQATEFLERRIEDGIAKGKKGYPEINSRIGGMFLKVPTPSLNDVKLVLNTNGIYEDEIITKIYNMSEGDLRIVKKKAKAFLMTKTA